MTQLSEADHRNLLAASTTSTTSSSNNNDNNNHLPLLSNNNNSLWNAKMNMPALFENCVQTYVKVRLIERRRVCRVCGHSVTVDGADSINGEPKTSGGGERESSSVDLDSAFMSHVMEHSLKEIVESGGM